MKKYFVLLLLTFILVSCGKQENQSITTTEVSENTQQEVSENKENLVVENNSISNTGEVIETGSGEISENNSISIENKENLQNIKSNEKLEYTIETEEYMQVLYLVKDGNKIKIDSSEGRIEKIEFYKNFIVYEWISTGGMLKKIFDTISMKEVGKVRFGTWIEDKSIIYGCEEEGYGRGSIQFFNFSNTDSQDLFSNFYKNDQDSSVTSCLFNEKEKQFNFSIKNSSGEKKYTYSTIDKKLNEISR